MQIKTPILTIVCSLCLFNFSSARAQMPAPEGYSSKAVVTDVEGQSVTVQDLQAVYYAGMGEQWVGDTPKKEQWVLTFEQKEREGNTEAEHLITIPFSEIRTLTHDKEHSETVIEKRDGSKIKLSDSDLTSGKAIGKVRSGAFDSATLTRPYSLIEFQGRATMKSGREGKFSLSLWGVRTIAFENTKRSSALPSLNPSTPSKHSAVVPPMSRQLPEGKNQVRVRNPNPFNVTVAIRSGNAGTDFQVPAEGIASASVEDGKYEVYFVYSTDPDGLYQGDTFTLNGNGVEIQIVKVVNGNYGIRKVK